MEAKRSFGVNPQIVLGLLIIAVGVLFMLDKLDLVVARDFLRFWPVLLIVFGLARILQPAGTPGRVFGLIILLLGTGWLLNALDVVSFHLRDWWPAILIIVGGSLLFRSNWGRHRFVPAAGDDDSVVRLASFMGGLERQNRSQEFRGGQITAVMGGCNLDLRQASMKASEAAIDVFAFWGGIEIHVPDDWTVVVNGMPIMGAIEDKTRPPKVDTGKRLIVKGTAVMGGVEIGN